MAWCNDDGSKFTLHISEIYSFRLLHDNFSIEIHEHTAIAILQPKTCRLFLLTTENYYI